MAIGGDSYGGESFGDLFKNPAALDQYEEHRRQQAAMLEQHRRHSEGMERVQQANQTRMEDIGLVDRLSTMLAPETPGKARRFLFREMTRHLGMDPKADSAKEAGAMLTGLDPQTSASVRSLLVRQLRESNPGDIQGMVKGIIGGQVPMHELVKQVRMGTMAAAAETQQAVGGSRLGQSAAAAGEAAMAGGGGGDTMLGVAGASEGDAPAVVSPEAEKIKSPWDEPIAPELSSRLGRLEPGTEYTYRDAARVYSRIPRDPKKQMELAENLDKEQIGLVGLAERVKELNDLLETPGATLGAMSGVVRFGEAVRDQLKQAMERWGGWTPSTMAEVNRVTAGLTTVLRLPADAETAARIRSVVIGLAYDMARQNEASGRQLSNQDFERALAQIGATQSRDQFPAVLENVMKRGMSLYETRVRTWTGAGDVMDVSVMSDAQLRAVARIENLPTGMAQLVAREDARREAERIGAAGPSRRSEPSATPAGGPAGVTPTTPGGEAPAGGPPAAPGPRGDAPPSPTVAPGRAAASPGTPDYAPRTIKPEERRESLRRAMAEAERLKKAIAEELMEFRRAGERRAGAEEGRATERMEMARGAERRSEAAEGRATRQEERTVKWREEDKADQRMQRLQAALASIGKLIAGSVPSMGGLGGSGSADGAQDAGAFVIPRKGSRPTPPSPGGRR